MAITVRTTIELEATDAEDWVKLVAYVDALESNIPDGAVRTDDSGVRSVTVVVNEPYILPAPLPE